MSKSLDSNILIPKLAKKAERYQQEILFKTAREVLGIYINSRKNIQEGLTDPRLCLGFFYRHFAFARAGGETAGYSDICLEIIRELPSRTQFESAVISPRFPRSLWRKFRQKCQSQNIGVNEKVNRKAVEGLAFLAGNCMKRNQSIAETIVEIAMPGNFDQAYILLRTKGGLGLKISAFSLRDLVWIWDLEASAGPEQRIFVQPVDTWIWQIAGHLWPELDHDRIDEFIVAHRLAIECFKLEVSSVEFNQGAWLFGSQEVGDSDELGDRLAKLQSE